MKFNEKLCKMLESSEILEIFDVPSIKDSIPNSVIKLVLPFEAYRRQLKYIEEIFVTRFND